MADETGKACNGPPETSFGDIVLQGLLRPVTLDQMVGHENNRDDAHQQADKGLVDNGGCRPSKADACDSGGQQYHEAAPVGMSSVGNQSDNIHCDQNGEHDACCLDRGDHKRDHGNGEHANRPAKAAFRQTCKDDCRDRHCIKIWVYNWVHESRLRAEKPVRRGILKHAAIPT